MRARVLVDTGPLVAFVNRHDHFHAWAREQFGAITPPLLTCEAVLTEACFLLGRLRGGAEAVMKLMSAGAVAAPFRLEQEVAPVQKLLRKYANVPISLADACLVRMSELVSESAVLTLDEDFRIYRRHGRQVVATILPPR